MAILSVVGNDCDILVCMKKILLFIGVPILILVLMVWGKTAQNGALVMIEGTNVACLPNGHQQLAIHIHPVLTIVVDGESEVIPANIGIVGTCMAELHTHDTTGVIHVETATQERFTQITFADFFDVWGRSVEREGYDLEIRYDGAVVDTIIDVPLEDNGQIELLYTSIEG